MLPARAYKSLSLVLLSVMATAPASMAYSSSGDDVKSDCEALLPLAPQVVIDPDEGVFSYVTRPESESPDVVPVVADLTLHLIAPLDTEIEGEWVNSEVRFVLPVGDLPEDTEIEYRVSASVGYEVHVSGVVFTSPPTPCDTGAGSLFFILSDHSPTSALALPFDERKPFIKASAITFGHAMVEQGVPIKTADEARQFCQDTFDYPTPCDWAPGEEHEERTDNSVVVEPMEAVFVGSSSEDASSQASTCKTVRYDDASDFSATTSTDPDGEVLWGSTATAQESEANGNSRANVRAQVSGGVFGSSGATAEVRYGRFTSMSFPSDTKHVFTIKARIGWRAEGRSHALVLGGPAAGASYSFDSKAYFGKTGGVEYGSTNGVSSYDYISTPPPPIPPVWSSDATFSGTRDDTFANLPLKHGQGFHAIVGATASVGASAFGAAYAESDTDADERYQSNGATGEYIVRYVQVNFVDLTLPLYPLESWANWTSNGGECIAD